MGDMFPILSYGRLLWVTRSPSRVMRGRYGRRIPHSELWEVALGDTFLIWSYERSLWAAYSPSRAMGGRCGQHIPHRELCEVVVGDTFPISSICPLHRILQNIFMLYHSPCNSKPIKKVFEFHSIS